MPRLDVDSNLSPFKLTHMIEAGNNMALDTLNILAPFLSSMHKNCFIVGTTSLVLQGVETLSEEIDIVTDQDGATKLARFLSRFKKSGSSEEITPNMSLEVSQYQVGGITVKVMSNLKVKVNEGWVKFLELVSKKEVFDFNGYAISIPSLPDQLKISRLFGNEGKEKDMRDAEKISNYLKA